MPMLGHLTENGLIIHEEFREGNAAPASRNREFIQACKVNISKGKRIARLRADSATYQEEVINDCEKDDAIFAIAANSTDTAAAVMSSYRMRGEHSENRNQGTQNWIRYRTDALWTVCSQCHVLSNWYDGIQPVRYVQGSCIARCVGEVSGTNGALALVSDSSPHYPACSLFVDGCVEHIYRAIQGH